MPSGLGSLKACCNHRGSNHIEDTIDITYHFSKVGGGIIDHFISTEAEQGLAMLSRSHGDHVCTFEMGKLDGGSVHTTSGTLDEDTLSRLQVPLLGRTPPQAVSAARERAALSS